MSRYFPKELKPRLSTHERFHRDSVYALNLMPNGEFLPLNRDYKPLGVTWREAGHVNYHEQATLPLDVAVVKKVASNNHVDCHNPECWTYWLYNDASCPGQGTSNMRVYKQKLELLGLPLSLNKAVKGVK